MKIKTFTVPFVALIAVACAADSVSKHAELWSSRAERLGTPKFELVCNDTCHLDSRGDNAPSIPLDNCSTDKELCIWRDDFINLYVPRSNLSSWSFRDRDYEREPEGGYDVVYERNNGKLTKTYFVFEDRVWMIVHSNRHGWDGDDGRGMIYSNAHDDSMMFVINY